MKKLQLKYKLDDLIYSLYNRSLDLRLTPSAQAIELKKNKKLKNSHSGEKCFILGNGPSLNEMDLGKISEHETFACNYFYKHPSAAACNPSFYVIVDPKLLTGEWPVSMLDEIRAIFPKIKLFLNIDFKEKKEIRDAVAGADVYWIKGGKIIHPGYRFEADLTRRIGGDNVTKFCLQIALYLGFKKIFFAGIDGDGLFRELSGKSSHFYVGSDNMNGADFDRMLLDLWFSTEGFRSWRAIADRYAGSDIELMNCGIGGLLNCLPRISLEEAAAR